MNQSLLCQTTFWCSSIHGKGYCSSPYLVNCLLFFPVSKDVFEVKHNCHSIEKYLKTDYWFHIVQFFYKEDIPPLNIISDLELFDYKDNKLSKNLLAG